MFQRTLELCHQNRQRQAELQLDGEEYRRGYTAVSYTHLDVYKRQM